MFYGIFMAKIVKINKKDLKEDLISSWCTIVREVRTIIQADILDNLGQKEASML